MQGVMGRRQQGRGQVYEVCKHAESVEVMTEDVNKILRSVPKPNAEVYFLPLEALQMIPIMVILFALAAPQQEPPSYLDEVVELRQETAVLEKAVDRLQTHIEELDSCIRIMNSIDLSPKDPNYPAEFEKQRQREIHVRREIGHNGVLAPVCHSRH